ncbi:MAG: hypothetical protein JNG84_02000, partial [Archangium sp.]|nr:hypothetical protein [Archangium sp.]
LGLGAVTYLDPRADRLASARALCGIPSASPSEDGVDLAYELSGRPEVLETALSLCRREGRVVVGSWYGSRAAPIHFGTRAHRRHQSIHFSNVSTISSALAGRFDKARRMAVAMSWLQRLPLEPLVTHRVPIARCAEAFAVLDESPPGCLQVVLTYPPLEA